MPPQRILIILCALVPVVVCVCLYAVTIYMYSVFVNILLHVTRVLLHVTGVLYIDLHVCIV